METNTALINHARDFISAGGSPAKALLRANGDTQALRTNDVLRKDEWELLDETLVGIARQRLIGINDLRNRGLVENTGGLGVLLSQYEQLGDMSAADVDFAGVTDGEKDSVTFTLVSVPVPIIHKDFSINIRRLLASRGSQSHGSPIDRTQVEVAGQKVAEQMEEILFNGFSGGSLDGNALLGYTNAPDVNTEAGSDWGTATNVQIDVIDAIDELEADSFFGPWVMYVATTQFGQLRTFFTDGSGDQVFDRLARIQGLEDVRPGDRLSAGNAVLVSMRRDVVDLAIGQELTVVEWETKGGLMMHFKVMTAMAARVKSTSDDKSGICTITGI